MGEAHTLPTGEDENRVPLTRPELAVLVSGVASMGLEILAGRIVAPTFGSSVYTWGSIIGVFLTGLSLGYWRGGLHAATQATDAQMGRFLTYAAGYVGALLLVGQQVLTATAGLPVPDRFAPLVPVTLLFGPPAYFLGFISPYAAELSRADGTGLASGRVYALGTAGSIVGAFGTTFLLIPTFHIDLIGLFFGVLLLAAAVGLAGTDRTGPQTVRVVVAGVVLFAAVASGGAGVGPSDGVVYQTQTPYQNLAVVDDGDVRTLYLGGVRHSAMDRSNPQRHVFDYTRYFHLPLLMTEDVDRVLFVGGGGFTGPKIFAAKYNVTVDVVEIDPEVIRVAKRYFGVEEREGFNIYNEPGRRYLQETNETYDVIVLDAYKKDKVPFQLTTVEFMRLASSHLDEDGVLLANVISAPSGPGSGFHRAEYKTMAQVFPQVYSFRTSRTGLVQNIELVATKQSTYLSQAELERRNRQRDVGIDLSHEISFYRSEVQTDDVPVLRDGKAPVDELLDPLVGRRYVIEENGTATATPAGAG